MSHYVCTGDCKNVSDVAGVCQSDFCNKAGEELAICGCEDGEHTDAKPSENTTEEEGMM